MAVQNMWADKLRNNRSRIWYAVCFLALGVIDQRRGSATGETQMLFSNLTGVVLALMLLPSLNLSKFREKIYLFWTPACLILSVIACMVGKKFWPYEGQWVTGVLNVAVWSYLLIYIVKERKSLVDKNTLRLPFFLCILIMLLLMQVSVHGGILPLWYLLIFGGFYAIGIPKEKREDFFVGMMNGIIFWFFIQQALALAFRPYDRIRYRGFYSGATQNGLFYMIAYCAFLTKWIWCREKRAGILKTGFHFFFAAASFGLMVFTGGRSALAGAVVISLVLIVGYDLLQKKSWKNFLSHGVALGVLILMLMPAAYCSIRYIPAVLHHPIWYEGEYLEGITVCSYDSWDSPKYISFEQAMEGNVGRILEALGIDYHALIDKFLQPIAGMKVYAAESIEDTDTRALVGEPGSSPENPYVIEGIDLYSAMGARIVIYSYYLKHMNLWGHFEQGFYISEDVFMGHAHNMFIQMAYDYGIIAGLLYLGICCYSVIRAFKMRKPEGWICLAFLLSIFCFGLTEMAVTPGQITVPLVWIMFYFVGNKSMYR